MPHPFEGFEQHNFHLSREIEVLRFSKMFIAASVLAITSLAVPGTGQAQDVAAGVAIEVMAEYPSNTAGVEKILFRKITLKPGASWSTTVPAQSVCQGTMGELLVVNHTTGAEVTFKAGDRWSTIPGHQVTLSNPGSIDHEHLFYTLIVAK
ncbi:MAG: hypothetical protein HRU33_13875 [Rhodobacteraceae bacterium]|nr:hypothetical protein [Paracoccaceae bacterium]